ncbi:murein transglycosylase A [Magnetococcales bacterium HHB-1]
MKNTIRYIFGLLVAVSIGVVIGWKLFPPPVTIPHHQVSPEKTAPPQSVTPVLTPPPSSTKETASSQEPPKPTPPPKKVVSQKQVKTETSKPPREKSIQGFEAAAKRALKKVPWKTVKEELSKDKTLKDWSKALRQSAGYYKKFKKPRFFRFGPKKVSAKTLAKSCLTLAKTAEGGDFTKLWSMLTKEYWLYESIGRKDTKDVLVTAYYEPLLNGSYDQSEKYPYPVYHRPDDLVEVNLGLWSKSLKGRRVAGRVQEGKLHPYYSRQEIDEGGRLKNKKLELAWVDNDVDLFFLQIQGSGRIRIHSDEQKKSHILRVGYAAANGRPYRSIGKLLINEKAIPAKKMSVPALRAWLKKNPKEKSRVLNYNKSYVFFRELDGGPYGNIGVALTPERSIATDYRLFPRGAPAILTTRLPQVDRKKKKIIRWQEETLFVVNQDTGGAIRGPGRVDFFMGFGPKAELTAGRMKQKGSRLFFIVPKGS